MACSKGNQRSLPDIADGAPPIDQQSDRNGRQRPGAGDFDIGGKVRAVDLRCSNTLTLLDPATKKPVATQLRSGGGVIRPGLDDTDMGARKDTPISGGVYSLSYKISDRSADAGRVKNVVVNGQIDVRLAKGGTPIAPTKFSLSLDPANRRFRKEGIVLSNRAEFMDVECVLLQVDPGPGGNR